jgi:hypothetical protein
VWGGVRGEEEGFGEMQDLGWTDAGRFRMAGAGLMGMLIGGLGGMAVVYYDV